MLHLFIWFFFSLVFFERYHFNVNLLIHTGRTPTNMLSLVTSLTPFSGFNQTPRSMYRFQVCFPFLRLDIIESQNWRYKQYNWSYHLKIWWIWWRCSIRFSMLALFDKNGEYLCAENDDDFLFRWKQQDIIIYVYLIIVIRLIMII